MSCSTTLHDWSSKHYEFSGCGLNPWAGVGMFGYFQCSTNGTTITTTSYACTRSNCSSCSQYGGPTYSTGCTPLGYGKTTYQKWSCDISKPSSPLPTSTANYYPNSACSGEPVYVVGNSMSCSRDTAAGNYTVFTVSGNQATAKSMCIDSSCNTCGRTYEYVGDNTCRATADPNMAYGYPYYKASLGAGSGGATTGSPAGTSAGVATTARGIATTRVATTGNVPTVVALAMKMGVDCDSMRNLTAFKAAFIISIANFLGVNRSLFDVASVTHNCVLTKRAANGEANVNFAIETPPAASGGPSATNLSSTFVAAVNSGNNTGLLAAFSSVGTPQSVEIVASTTTTSSTSSTTDGCFVGNFFVSPCPSAATGLSVQLVQLVLVAAAVIIATSLW
eukprot:TRINITY_DN482_c0_g1_i3.p2 TRINITY_DN482_c0_g1~~TRINITY_DN482_c0_g1_i3.p2  ORF type:complete len:392 (+),score=126.03 TRINITY_DN482_c0_g1_i3:170-1345(+)